MLDIVRKYAKDLIKGDKVNMHEKGWVKVLKCKRIRLSNDSLILFENMEPMRMNSHVVFENVVTEI